MFINLSILLFLYRIFHVREFKLWVIGTGIVLLLWGGTTVSTLALRKSLMVKSIAYKHVLQTMLAIFSCHPIRQFWEIETPNRKCVPELPFFLGLQIPNVVIDLVIIILPLPYLWKLQISLPQRIAISGIFILGGLWVPRNPFYTVMIDDNRCL